MGRRICQQTGKVSFVRHQDAAKQVGSVFTRKTGLADTAQSFYQCEFCKRWHVTSLPPQETTALQRQKRRVARLQKRRGGR